MLKDRQAVRFKPGFSPAIFFLLVPLHTAAASGLTAVIGNDDAVRTSEARVATHPYFEGVFHQQERYSCGTAALASLLTYWIGDKTSENSLLDRLLGQHGSADRERIFARGLDTKDLATLASSLGYQQRWQTVSIEHYRRVREPVIIFMVYEGEPHWTIYKGYANGEVYLADPSLGNVRMPASEFERMWAIQDDSRIGLMWALQRDDLRNLGQSSPLVDLTPSNHRTPSELRAMAAFGRVPGTRQSITTSLSKSRSSTVVGLYGQAVLLSTSQQTLRQSWSGEVGKGLVTDVSIAYSRSSTRASVGTGVFEDHDSGWRDLTISTLKLVPVNSESIAAVGVTAQLPTNTGAWGLGLSSSIAWARGPFTSVLSVRHLSQFSGTNDLEVQSRPRTSFIAAVTSQLSLRESTSLSITASYTTSGKNTLALGSAPRQTSNSLEISMGMLFGKQYQIQPSLSFTRSHGVTDNMVSLAITNSF